MKMSITTLHRQITLEQMQRFMGEAKDSIHSDPELAKSWGIGGAVVQGGHLVALINELMVANYGTGYLAGGDISVSFLKTVRADDSVVVHAVPSDKQERDGSHGLPRISCDVWIENSAGEKVVSGVASSLILSQ
jgi:acyl dehydratase